MRGVRAIRHLQYARSVGHQPVNAARSAFEIGNWKMEERTVAQSFGH